MLFRADTEGWSAFSQPAHSWVAGQLARAWGNERFGPVVPAADMELASSLHDLGFLRWEEAPTLHPKTGLPHSFLELPTDRRLQLWSEGVRLMLQFNRYAALLVSLHYTALRQRHPTNGPEAAQWAQNFLDEQDALQHQWLADLRADPRYAPHCASEVLDRNRRLMAVWDWLSLTLYVGFADREEIRDVPTAHGHVTLVLTVLSSAPQRVRVAPWPFQGRSVRLVCEGRRLLRRSEDEPSLQRNLQMARPVTLAIELVPG